MPNSPAAQESPNILSFIRFHNNMGLLTASFILEKKTDEERVKVCDTYTTTNRTGSMRPIQIDKRERERERENTQIQSNRESLIGRAVSAYTQ